MKHRHTPAIDCLERKLVLSRTTPFLAQAAHLLAQRQAHIGPLMAHAPRFQPRAGLPQFQQASPGLGLRPMNRVGPYQMMRLARSSGIQLVPGQQLRMAASPAQANTGYYFGGGNIDRSIPLVLSYQVGAAQNALNFTSNTYQNVLFGTGGWNGIQQIVTNYANNYSNSGSSTQLVNDLSALSYRIPYGNQQLLQTWLADLQSLQNGTLTPTASNINWDGGNTIAQAVGDTLFQDLQNYLAAGLGYSFNILKSNINWSNSDNLLTYNGTVAANGSNDTTVPVAYT